MTKNNENIIEIRNLNLYYHNNDCVNKVLEDVNIDVKKGKITSIIGESGCGKSTMLKTIAGINTSYDGQILFEGNKIRGPHKDRGFIFQEPALFEWLTVRDNISYGLIINKVSKSDIKVKVDSILGEIGLKDYENYYPNQLSGGMQQRVSLARSLIMEPKLLLMDEPFSALDFRTKIQMQDLVMNMWQKYGPSIVFVTHDIEEAIYLADRLIVIGKNSGRIVKEFDIDFSRARSKNILSSEEFVTIKRQILDIFLGNDQ